MNIRVREVFLKKTLRIFVILNAVVLIWGIGVCVYTLLYLRLYSGRVATYIREQVGFDNIALLSVIVSSGFLVVTAIVGLLGAYFELPLLFNSYRTFFGGAITLKVFSVVWAATLYPVSFLQRFLQFFKMESILLQHNHKIWNKTGLLWDTLQTELQCCALNDFRDWINSPCHCLPVSCCRTSKLASCKKLIQNKFEQLDVDHIKSLMVHTWNKNCIVALREGMQYLQESLVIFSIGLLLINLLLYTFCSHLIKLIEHQAKKVNREESDFDGKFGIWLLEPSDTDFDGIAEAQRKQEREQKEQQKQKEEQPLTTLNTNENDRTEDKAFNVHKKKSSHGGVLFYDANVQGVQNGGNQEPQDDVNHPAYGEKEPNNVHHIVHGRKISPQRHSGQKVGNIAAPHSILRKEEDIAGALFYDADTRHERELGLQNGGQDDAEESDDVRQTRHKAPHSILRKYDNDTKLNHKK